MQTGSIVKINKSRTLKEENYINGCTFTDANTMDGTHRSQDARLGGVCVQIVQIICYFCLAQIFHTGCAVQRHDTPTRQVLRMKSVVAEKPIVDPVLLWTVDRTGPRKQSSTVHQINMIFNAA